MDEGGDCRIFRLHIVVIHPQPFFQFHAAAAIHKTFHFRAHAVVLGQGKAMWPDALGTFLFICRQGIVNISRGIDGKFFIEAVQPLAGRLCLAGKYDDEMINVTITFVMYPVTVVIHRIPDIELFPGKVRLLLIGFHQDIFDQNFSPRIVTPLAIRILDRAAVIIRGLINCHYGENFATDDKLALGLVVIIMGQCAFFRICQIIGKQEFIKILLIEGVGICLSGKAIKTFIGIRDRNDQQTMRIVDITVNRRDGI